MAKTSTCRRCGARVEYVNCKDPYWRHTGPVRGAPHGAVPTR
jgi:hypothetical protein